VEDKQALSNPGTEDLLENMQKGNMLFKDVHHAREGSLDSLWLRQASLYGLEQINRISVGKEFNPEEFISKLKVLYAPVRRAGARDEEVDAPDESSLCIDWQKLGHETASLFYRKAPAVTFMFGPIQVEPKVKERKKVQRKKINENIEAVQPEQIVQQQKEESETSRKVATIFKQLKKKKRS
jgi:hypothetical protein